MVLLDIMYYKDYVKYEHVHLYELKNFTVRPKPMWNSQQHISHKTTLEGFLSELLLFHFSLHVPEARFSIFFVIFSMIAITSLIVASVS